jgi:hypothetical protein
MILYVGEHNLIKATGLKDEASGGDYLDGTATVEMTLKDLDGATVTNASGLSLSYISGSSGNFEGSIPSNAAMAVGQEYMLEVTITTAGGVVGFRQIPCAALYDDAE